VAQLEVQGVKKVFPFYVVCDVSRSMWDESFHPGRPITPFMQVEMSIPALIDTLEQDPVTYDTAHIAIVTFGDKPEIALPLTALNEPDPRKQSVIKALTKQYATNYSAVFELLLYQVLRDLEDITTAGNRYYRPVIYFITDGNPQVNGIVQPLEEWLPKREMLSTWIPPESRPTIIALGLGDASPENICRIRSEQPKGVACIAKGGTADELLKEIINSVVSSIGSSVRMGEIQFRVPRDMQRLDC